MRATSVVPAWVEPWIGASGVSMRSPSFGDAMVIFGGLRSRIQVTIGEWSDSPVDARKRVAEMSLRPSVSSNGISMRLVVPTGQSTTGAGSRPSSAR